MKNSYFYRQHQRESRYLKDAILVGKYSFPLLRPTQVIPQNVYSYTERNSVADKQNSWLDFFIDDSHFMKIGKIKYLYIFRELDELKRIPAIKSLFQLLKYERLENIYSRLKSIIKSIQVFEGVIAPDFSLYPEMSEATRIYNARKSRIVAYYMQELGVNIIPSLAWSCKGDFEWCFDGIPKNSSVAISTNGCKSEEYSKKIFLEGIKEIQEKLQPSNLIVCGSGFKELEEYKNMIYYPSYSQRLYLKCVEEKLKKNKGQYELPFVEEEEIKCI